MDVPGLTEDQLLKALQDYVRSGRSANTDSLRALLARRRTGLERHDHTLKDELDDIVDAMWRDRDPERVSYDEYHRDRKALREILDLGHSSRRSLEERRRLAGRELGRSEGWFRKTHENRVLGELARAMLRPEPEHPPWLPAPEGYFGHEDQRQWLVERIVEASRDDQRAIIRVQGEPGIGKSAFVLQCALDRRIGEHFGLRRYLVACEGVQSGDELLSAIASALQVPLKDLDPRGNQKAVRAELDPTPHLRRPALLILDGLEAVLADDELGVEDLLWELSNVTAKLALVCTSRDTRKSEGRNICFPIARLTVEAARELFNSRTHRKFAGDPKLDDLLNELCRLPLAIKLICAPALKCMNIASVLDAWSESKTDMLGDAFGTALRMSIDGINKDARDLLSMIGPLRAGVAPDARVALLDDNRHEHAVDGLCRASLATSADPRTARLHVHELIRDHVSRHRRPAYKDLERVFKHYCDLAIRYAPKPGHAERAAAIQRMRLESANVIWAIATALEAQDPLGADATVELQHYAWFAGVSVTDFEERAIEIARQEPRPLLLGAIGLIALARSDHSTAERCFGDMLDRCPVPGTDRATAILNLAELDLRRFTYDAAAARFDVALSMYRDFGDLGGQANCLLGLGQVALRGRDLKTATCCFDDAAPLYRDVNDDLGKLNCIKGTGDIAWRRGDLKTARARFKEALTGYTNLGHALASANCDRDLAELDLRRGDFASASEHIARSEELYRRIENTLGMANCRAARAELALKHGNVDEAREHVIAAGDGYDKVHCEAGKQNCNARRESIDHHLEGATGALELPRRPWIPDDNA